MELLVVMVIMAILMAFIATVLIRVGSRARVKKALADIAKISLALTEYHNHFGEYPPDTGYGLNMNGTDNTTRPEYLNSADNLVPTYDPGSLWRYLCRRMRDPRSGELVGPFLEEWPQTQMLPYNDRYEASSRYLSDPWGNPYGYIGTGKRVLHSPGSFDIFSAGPDGVTACNNGIDDPLLGQDLGDEFQGDQHTDCSTDPQSEDDMDNRAYNTELVGGDWTEIDDDGNGIANDSEEFGPEAIRNGDIGDDVNSWRSR